jgi:polyisoprenyl-teichoic acid--peptidoglycan teichoic acid transferase
MPRRRRPVRLFFKRLLIALCTATVSMTGAVLAVNYVINTKLSSVSRVGLRTARHSTGPENFLVVGSDTRAFTSGNKSLQQQFGNEAGNGGQRSDTMMLIRVDPDRGTTLVISFPRDLWVQIPGMGLSKINAAYNAGPQKVIDTLKQDFNININHFVQVDFSSFQGVVNAIGTIPVYVQYPARDNQTGLYQPIAGCEQFSGADALAYVRSRELQYYSPTRGEWLAADGVPDINRIARQQQFIKRLAGIAVKSSLSNPLTANTIVNRVLKNVTVDSSLSKDDILALVDAFRTINPNDAGHVQFATMPWVSGPTQGGGQDVLYVQQPAADTLLARVGGSADPNQVSINGNPPVGSAGSTTNGSTGGTTNGSTGSTSTSTSTTTTTTTAPQTTTPAQRGTPGAAPTPAIENQKLFGSPAPKSAPC